MTKIIALEPITDLEIEMGQLIQKYVSQGIDFVIDALDFYTVQLETARDQSMSSSPPVSPSENSK
jgi:tRNA A37 threonylcarbamoyladenosine dehydratase